MHALIQAVVEVEAHAHQAGWDGPPRLYALVPTDELVAREPVLAEQLGLDAATAAGTLTPVEQEQVPLDRPLEDTLQRIMWPAEVTGCAAVLERLTLPTHAEADLPDDHAEAQEYAENHPDRQEVRMAVGVSRDGTQHCVLRVRTHDGASEQSMVQHPLVQPPVVQGPDLVPQLVRLLRATLVD